MITPENPRITYDDPRTGLIIRLELIRVSEDSRAIKTTCTTDGKIDEIIFRDPFIEDCFSRYFLERIGYYAPLT